MPITIENHAHLLSGVVLFPEADPRNINLAMARQLGMATNAHIVDGDVRVGTVHAFGYDPRLAIELQGIDRAEAANRRISETDEERRRQLLDEIASSLRAGFDERGLAAHGLGSALQSRNVDIIVPPGIKPTQAMQTNFGKLAGEGINNRILPSLWAAKRGIITQLNPDFLGNSHPLTHPNPSAQQTQRTVRTTGDTLLPVVKDQAVYNLPLADPRLESSGTGWQITSLDQRFTTLTAQYDVPLGKHGTAIAATLGGLDLQNQQKEQRYEDYARAGNSDSNAILVDVNNIDSLHAGYLDTTFVDRVALALELDPADSPIWQLHLT